MEKYLVGGAVRDTLLKLPIKEKDWVVVGSSPQEMLNIGYIQVGKDFPVFLHPKNREEYALARTERKSGKGYIGFTCYTDPSITIEEDLYRRDLTINAMAYDSYGNLIDPYHGQEDIKLRVLRHVSHSFNEDPLRVLRVARFAARFAHINFTVAPETLVLMEQMIAELPLLSPERIWMETKKALTTNSPQVYFQILRRCGALNILFPELDKLFSISSCIQDNTRTNTSYQIMKALAQTAHLTKDLSIRFSILCSNLNTKINCTNKGKSLEYHNEKILEHSPIDSLCNRLKIPHEIRNFTKIVSKHYNYLYHSKIEKPETLMTLFKAFDCWRRPERIEKLILVSQKHNTLKYIKYNNQKLSNYEHLIRTAFVITKKISSSDIIKDGFSGANISKELYARRLRALNAWKNKKYKK